MRPIAEINPLVGRHFVSPAGNVCHVVRLGEGALRAKWKSKPTPEDCQAVVAWMRDVLGNVEATVCLDPAREQEELAAWKKGRT